jgi:hypothetical protein
MLGKSFGGKPLEWKSPLGTSLAGNTVGVSADAGLRYGLTQWKAKPLMCSPSVAKFQMIYNRMMEAQRLVKAW